MPLINMKQVQGGEELQGNVKALLDIIGKDKEAFFNEMLNWFLSEAPQDFNPEILRNSKLVKLVSSAVTVNNEFDMPTKTPYLSFIEENGEPFTLKTSNTSKNWDGTLEYSINAKNWSEWNGTKISSSNNGELYLRGTGNTVITNGTGGHFALTENKSIKCIGNIENLLDYKTVKAGNHPVMAESCYKSMFYYCSSITQAPELPATTLANYCYNNMFIYCTSLTQTPKLPATTLANYCYNNMFNGCTSLTAAPELPATTLATCCYEYMFNGCTSLTQAPELPATALTNSCYNSMFNGCTSLVQAPAELPATTLATNCYSDMFNGCTGLTGEIHCPSSTASNSRRLDKIAHIPANTATVVYDL